MAVLFRGIIFVLAFLLIAVTVVLRVLYGGGNNYPDLTTPPLLGEDRLEVAVRSAEPVGNVAVSRDGRIFFTIHPESRPDHHRLVEWRNNAAIPYPDEPSQKTHFQTPLGIVIDQKNRLWTIDHGFHGLQKARLSAFDLDSSKLVHDFIFPDRIAGPGSFLQDLQVDSSGETVYIADASIFRRNPAIIVYDVKKKTARRVLESDPSVFPQDWVIRNPIREMVFLGGLITLKPGVDGIALDQNDEWLYYAPVTHDSLFRVRTADLRNPQWTTQELSSRVEPFGRKPLNDGILAGKDGSIYITDVEHGSVMRLGTDKKLQTVIRSSRIRWADSLSMGPDGYIYLADSALPHLILQSKSHMRSQAPYYIFRFKSGSGEP
ncbi:MAG TPA: L-dopachrome tautomerase-related protein [Syntrophales bacterium]|jgi:sugar lactone lactonase YvrE|nr:L-dopachrome tautomerase-related protein [Syntrophales bacterium]